MKFGINFNLVLMLSIFIIFVTISANTILNIWYISDDGSDDNYCHSKVAPCQSLQSVVDRAIDGATIYVTSDTLSLDALHQKTWYLGYYL